MTDTTHAHHHRQAQLLVFVDVETTGLDPLVNDVISVAAIRVEIPSWIVLDEMSCLVHPITPESMTPQAEAINRYDADRWSREAVTWQVARDRLQSVAQGAGLSAHNRAFDASFLSTWYGGSDGRRAPWTHRGVCTQALCASLIVAGLTLSNGLAEACGVLGIELDHHEALSDAQASMQVARKLLVPLAELLKLHFG